MDVVSINKNEIKKQEKNIKIGETLFLLDNAIRESRVVITRPYGTEADLKEELDFAVEALNFLKIAKKNPERFYFEDIDTLINSVTTEIAHKNKAYLEFIYTYINKDGKI